MSNNITMNPGIGGPSVATEEFSGVHYQKIIPYHGPSGAIERAALGSPLPVRALADQYDIESGNYFRAWAQKDVAASGGTLVMSMVTPDTTERCQLRIEVNVESEMTVEIFENPTSIGTGAAAFTPLNAERNSAHAAAAAVAIDPSSGLDTAGATTLFKSVIGAGAMVAGGLELEREWVLKQNEEYLVVITNGGGSDGQANLVAGWVEK